MKFDIIPFNLSHLGQVLELSVRSWEPVFPKMKNEIPAYVYDAFYPDGWKARQLADVESTCRDDETDMWVAVLDNKVIGYLGLREHKEDAMGEVYIIAVDPDYQRQGIGSALLDFAFDWMRQRGSIMAMVETGGDNGHSPSRQTYENAGFSRYPVARYFRKL